MTATYNPTSIYIGKRDAVMAEVGTLTCYEGEYLAQPIGDGEYDAIGASSKAEAKEIVEEYAVAFPGIEIIWL